MRLAAALAVAALALAGCSGSDGPLNAAQVPTTQPAVGATGGAPIVDATEAFAALGTAESSTDFCDVVAAFSAPLPTEGGPEAVELYERLAALAASSASMVPDGQEGFETLRRDWDTITAVLERSGAALEVAEGNVSDPVFVAEMRGDAATTAAQTIERYRLERCQG